MSSLLVSSGVAVPVAAFVFTRIAGVFVDKLREVRVVRERDDGESDGILRRFR